ncbi:MAG: AMIN domain-containing protein, partial [Thermodesulfobacteriota bacterium]
MRRLAPLLLITLATAAVAHAQQAGGNPGAARPAAAVRATIERIAWETVDGRGRLVVGVRGTVDYSTHVAGADAGAGMPPRAYVDLRPALIGKDVPRAQAVDDPLALRIRVGQFDAQTVRVVVDLSAPALFEVSTSERPPRLLLALRRRDAGEQVAVKQRLGGAEPAKAQAEAAAAQAPSPPSASPRAEDRASPAVAL